MGLATAECVAFFAKGIEFAVHETVIVAPGPLQWDAVAHGQKLFGSWHIWDGRRLICEGFSSCSKDYTGAGDNRAVLCQLSVPMLDVFSCPLQLSCDDEIVCFEAFVEVDGLGYRRALVVLIG